MTIRVGRWDCSQCGQIGILGPETKCTKCGASRSKNVKFYLPVDAKVVTNKEEIKKAVSGADWICSFCSTQNHIYYDYCKSCGNKRRKEDDIQLEEKTYALDEVPRSGKPTEEIAYKKTPQRRVEKPKEEPKRQKQGNELLWILSAAGFLIVVISILTLMFSTREISVTVERCQWEREIYTEAYREVQEEDWSIPKGGKCIRQYKEIHHYKNVADGYETKTRTVSVKTGSRKYVCGQKDLGNGYFQDQYCTEDTYDTRTETYQETKYRREPVYRTKYVYTIFKWVKAETLSASANNKEPNWPDDSIIKNTSTKRESGRKEFYRIIISDDKGHKHLEKMSFDKWQGINVGDKLSAKRNGFGRYVGLKK